MSARLLGIAIYADAPTPAARGILMGICDVCHDDGTRIFPSVARLALAGRCSERQVQRILRIFCGVGLLRVVKAASGRPGFATEYQMCVKTLLKMHDDGWEAVDPGRKVADMILNPPPKDKGACADEGSASPSPADEPGETGDNLSPVPKGETGDISGERGDSQMSPEPLYHPLWEERESAGASADAPADAGAPLDRTDAPTAEGEASSDRAALPGATLADFLKAWPTAFADNQPRIANAWAALPFHDRADAVRRVPAYLDHLKKVKRAGIPAGYNYLTHAMWKLMPAEAQAHRERCDRATLKAWSLEWWHVLLGRIAAGKPVSFMFDQAKQGAGFICQLGELPSEAERARYRGYRADSEVGRRWVAWLAGKRLRADFGDGMWLQLPAEAPPGWMQDESLGRPF